MLIIGFGNTVVYMVFSKWKVIEDEFCWPYVKHTNFIFMESVNQVALSCECSHNVMCCAVLCCGF